VLNALTVAKWANTIDRHNSWLNSTKGIVPYRPRRWQPIAPFCKWNGHGKLKMYNKNIIGIPFVKLKIPSTKRILIF
jgi:hypothetical protein